MSKGTQEWPGRMHSSDELCYTVPLRLSLLISTVTHVHICMHTLSVCAGLDFSSDDDDDEAEETAAARLIELESKQASLVLRPPLHFCSSVYM